MIYLDHNATTPILPEVKEAVAQAVEVFANPSSTHAPGLKARNLVEDAREQTARLINARPDEIIFTSGGTFSNNLAIMGFANRFPSGRIICSAVEHPSVSNPLKHLQNRGFEIVTIPVDSCGRVVVQDVKNALTPDAILISVMHSNNETGALQPLGEISRLSCSHGVILHTDAAQSVGKTPVDVNAPVVDMMTIAGHKLYAPKGVGALYVRRGIGLVPIVFGAGQERGLSPGTENVIHIAALGKACEIARRDIDRRVQHALKLTTLLYAKLREKIPGVKINGDPLKTLSNTLNVTLPGVNAAALLEKLKDKIAASTAAACHCGETAPSSVLLAMGLSPQEALSSIRFSVGVDNTQEDILRTVEFISEKHP
jgi:cysteine desulfurase